MTLQHCELCPYWLSVIHSCPSDIYYHSFSNSELCIEYFMIAMSILPYFSLFIVSIYSLIAWTLRGCVIVSMLIMQYILIELLKRIFKESRPEGACHLGYGFPSQHSCFAVLISLWLIFEKILFSKNAKFRQSNLYKITSKFMLTCAIPIIICRIYLNYHTMKQIIGGAVLGAFISCLYFFMFKFRVHEQKFIVFIIKKLHIDNNYAEKDQQNKKKLK